MAMLDRYKKKGGFIQLLTLIESSGKQKQDQFLGLIAQESPAWEAALRSKTLTLDKILAWNQTYLSEVLSRIQPLTLATALNGMPKDKVETILSCLGITDKRRIQQVIDESKPTPAEINTCIMKIIGETRALINTGLLKMDKVEPEMMIPDHIEEHLSAANLERILSEKVSVNPLGEIPAVEASPASASEGRPDHSREEVDFLKKKVNQLVAENGALKQEVAVLRGKMEQIRKIA